VASRRVTLEMLRFVSFDLHTLTTGGKEAQIMFQRDIYVVFAARQLPPLNYYMETNQTVLGFTPTQPLQPCSQNLLNITTSL